MVQRSSNEKDSSVQESLAQAYFNESVCLPLMSTVS